MSISISSNTAVSAAVAATQAQGAGQQQTTVLKKALDSQAAAAATLIAGLPQPALAKSGSLGTQVNTYA